jgi:hypothetical protein
MLARTCRRRERLQKWKYDRLLQGKESEEREEQELDTALHLLHPS